MPRVGIIKFTKFNSSLYIHIISIDLLSVTCQLSLVQYFVFVIFTAPSQNKLNYVLEFGNLHETIT
jgi:hypothetical protein